MGLLWSIIRNAFADLREELFLLALANMLWVVGAVPGIALLSYGMALLSLPLLALGLVALLPFPLVTFGLFHLIYAVSQRDAVGWKTFFNSAWEQKNSAYRWGGLNVAAMALLLANVRFYADPAAPLGRTPTGAALSAIFVAFTFLWLLWQLFTLTAFPRLRHPRLRAALRQAGIVLAGYPALALAIGMLAALLTVISILIPVAGLWLGFVLIGLLANQATRYVSI